MNTDSIMESPLNIPNVDISLVRRYSLGGLDEIDFSTSDDFAIVVENLKNFITLQRNIEEYWNEEHEHTLWQFVVDTASCILTAYFSKDVLILDCDIPTVQVNELFYIVKASPEKLISADYTQNILFGTAKAPLFESVYEILSTVYEPMFSEKANWSKCIKSDYKNHLSDFLLELFDMKNKLQGKLVFYAPDGIETKEVKSVIEQKELLSQVERTVIMWIWLLMSILMKQNNDNVEDSGPLQEIKFWETKRKELEKVLSQLEQKNVKTCIEIVKTAKLVSYFKFIDIKSQLQNEYDVASNNVKFLSILKKPCEDIESSTLLDIPKHLPQLLDFVRIIWNNSPYFKQQNEISNLLNKVNNFVITVISGHMPLNDIFDNKSSEQKNSLYDVISCCRKWLEIFDFSEKVHKKFAAHVWSVKPVSPLVNLSIHRCEELIQICQFKEDFCCKEDRIGYASGHKCFEISKQFKTNEVSFWNILHELGKSKHAVLHIKKAEWNEQFKKFKEQISELEISIAKLMVNAFENLNTIEEGIQILIMFQRYFEKQVIKRYLRKCIKSLYEIFFNELNFVKKEISELKTNDIPLLPKYGGTAFQSSLLPQRAKQLYKLLQEESYIWPREYDLDIENLYKQVLDSNAEFIHTLFLQWIKTIPKDAYGWLKDPIVTKKEDSLYLQLNLSSKTMNLIQELYYWDKTGVEIPQQVLQMHEKSEIFLKRILKMMEGVQNYNRLIQNVTFEDTEIFADVLKSMDDSIKPTIENLNWSAPPTAAKLGLKIISDQTKVVKEIFTQYESSKFKVKLQNEEISQKSLFSEDIPVSLDYTDFIHMQVSWKDKILQEVSDLIKNNIQDANQAYNGFKRKKIEMGSMPAAFSKKVIDLIGNALAECYETSLKSAATLFGANRRNKIRMVLNIKLTLKGHELCFVPNFKELCTGIVNLINDIENDLATCMVFEGLMLEDFDEKNLFIEKARNIKSIQELKKEIDYGLYLLYEAEKRYKSEWQPCACLWETNKTDLLKNYKETGWRVENFEKDINRFLDVAQEVRQYARYKVLEFCVVDCQPLKDSAVSCAEEWRNELGSILRKISCSNLQNAFDLFELTAFKFKQSPHNLEELNDAINFLNITKQFSKEIKLTFDGIQQSFDVLKKFSIPITEKAWDQQQNLSRRWKEMEDNFQNYYLKLQKVQAFHQRQFLEHHKELKKSTNILETEFYQKGPFKLEYSYSDALNNLSYYKKVLSQLQLKETVMQKDAVFFHLNIAHLEKLSSIAEDLKNLELAWTYVKQLDTYLAEWDNIPVMHFDAEQKKNLSNNLQNDIIDLQNKVKGTHWILLEELLTNIRKLNEYYEMVQNFQDPTLQERHWDDLRDILNLVCDNSMVFFHSKEFTFGMIRKVNVENLAENVNKITVCARKEYEIEQLLKEMEEKWKTVSFSLTDLKKYFKLEDTGSIISIVEAHQRTIKAIKRSKYMSHFKDKIDSLENSLLLILDVIEQAESFQNKFILLENIFTEQAAHDQYSFQAIELQSVKSMWKAVTNMMHSEKLVWNISHKPGFLEKLADMNKGLESMQKSLEFYLNSKRQAFPRFYYLSNEELLFIVGQKSPDAVQPYLQKCFDSINKLKIVENVEESLREQIITIFATGMFSALDEFIEFTNPVILEGPVELWMMEVEKAMQSTISTALPKCINALNGVLAKEEFSFENAKWFTDFSDQICMLSLLISWTAETTNSIRIVQETAVTTALKVLRKKWRDILNLITQKLQSEVELLVQKKTMMLILILAHSCDVIDSLIKYVCNDVEAFEWLVHLRYYAEEGQDPCIIRQTKAEFKYGFEYLGNRQRLVITPLTDRCFLSLTTALYMKQAVTLRGSKTSGKTETLKDLGLALGNYVLIINCSENIDMNSLVQILTGLAKIGAWGLFEDFNCVRREIVSVLSQQINGILHALAEKQKMFTLFGSEIPVKKGCGIFFSINPDFSSTIFENAQTFRPITIISPDISTILQVYLFAYGFMDVKVLAADIQLIFAMAKEQLSKRHFYNFGLRTIVQILKDLEQRKRTYSKINDLELIISTLKSTIVPKLDPFDVPIFEEILTSVLGPIKILENDNLELKNEIINTLKRKNLLPDVSISNKIHQLHEIKKNHHAIILFGESGTGKTTSWKTLKEMYLNLQQSGQAAYQTINVYPLNPKAFTINELFGNFTENSLWKDGLFHSILKKANANTRAEERWIILNGPVDIEWLGSINSLLNNSKTLTMANGERIIMSPEVTLIIETTDLVYSSPSTISCCGLLYFSPTTVHWKMYLRSWIKNLELGVIQRNLEEVVDKYFEKVLDFSHETLESYKLISSSHLNCVTSFTRIMESFLKKILSDKVPTVKLSRMFWFSIVWSVGAILDEKDRLLFDKYLKNLDSSLEQLSNIYEFGLDANFKWFEWKTHMLHNSESFSSEHFQNFLVPTVTTLSSQNIVSMLIEGMNPVLLIGKSGSGKTILMQDLLHKVPSYAYIHTTIMITSQVASSKLQQILEKQLEERAGGVLIPPSSKMLLAFLDDFDMGTSDKFSSQSSLEFLLMAIKEGIWYNRSNWRVHHIKNVCYLATANSHPDYRNKIPKPLVNSFSIINVPSPQEPDMEHIFSTLLKPKFFKANIDVQYSLNAISKASTHVYNAVNNMFNPIPSKLHYLFSLKDIKKVLCKISEMSDEILNEKSSIAKFWFHECAREISDRFVSFEDKEMFFDMINTIVEKQFMLHLNLKQNDLQDPKFVKFLGVDEVYAEVTDISMLSSYLENCVDKYIKSKCSQPVPILLFNKNIEHLCHVIRGIENAHGNIILVGATGTGKRSLSRIAAYILEYEVFEITFGESYGISEFKNDLHNALFEAGVNENKILLLFSDDQVVHDVQDVCLHYLSEVLILGVPFGLFSQDELNMMYSKLSSSVNENKEIGKYHEVVVENIKNNLHLIFCIAYNSKMYMKLFLNYPAFYKNSTIDWFEEWPYDALESIACKYLSDIELKPPDPEKRKLCFELLPEMHIMVLKYSNKTMPFETSSTFIKFVNTFEKVLTTKQIRVEYDLNRLNSGLQKINETQEKVNEISKETKEAHEQLKIAEKECDEALKDITQKKIILAEKQKTIQEKTIEIEAKEKVAKIIAIAAEEDLNAALPALEEAQKALEALNKRDIGEIKSYAKPPVLVEIVLEAVMILRESEATWAEAKRQLGGPSFLKELIEYDRDNISDSALTKVGKYVKKPEFQPNLVGKVSFAAKSLCIWVRAMHLYGNIYKKVKPKMERLKAVKEELANLQKTLADLLQELNELEASISQLEKDHKMLIERKEEYARKEKELALKLRRAESIIEGLSSEKKRWEVKVSALREKKTFVLGDSFLASGYLTYLGPHDQSHRIHMKKVWQKNISDTGFAYNPDFDLADFFVDESVKEEWKTNGLPNDQYSQEGATIVKESMLYSFVVDPEGQANKWIRNMEGNRKLKCVDFQDSKWMDIIETGIVEGFPVLLQNVNPQLDTSLVDLLKQPFSETSLQFNDKNLERHLSFQFYMATKLLNPQFSSLAIYQTSIVNFTIKEKGLEDQLLPLIVLNEQSDLETKKEKLVKSIRDCKNQLSEIEDTILKLLNKSQGSLLDNEVLVQALKESKALSIETEEKLVSSEKTEAIIDIARNKYRPCAKTASLLYFVLTDMTLVDCTYVFTLDSYIELFLKSISKSSRDSEVSKRILKLNEYHLWAVYRFACRTVLQKHSMLLAFYLCAKILLAEKKLDIAEYEFFIKGAQNIDRSQEPANPCSQWLSQESWDNITQLEHLPKFLSITISFDENSKLWQDWYLTLEPEKNPLPGIWRNICSEFHILLIIRCLRLDRVTNCIRSFVAITLGKNFLEYPSTDLKEVFKESIPNKPFVLFTLSTDIDLEKDISSLAKVVNVKYKCISLGEGQEKAASKLIIDSAKAGYWAFISHCHLLPSWLPTLEKFVTTLQTLTVHENFRLWLGSSPTNHFPTSILQNSVILSLDSPKGIRDNMLKLYNTFLTENEIETSSCPSKYKSLLFTLSFFHSILIERENFHNLGWHCTYSFKNQDFKVSMQIIKLYLDEKKDTPWDALRQIIAEVLYSGHLDNPEDERLLLTYYDQFFCDEILANVKYCFSELDAYYVPENGSLEDYLSFIKELPSTDMPEVFGQHQNAEIPYQVQNAVEMLNNMSKMEGESFSQVCNFEQVSGIISDIKQRIPDMIDKEAAIDILHEKSDPYSLILVQETKQYNHLLKIVLRSLNEIEEGICGTQMMTDELNDLSRTIQNRKVPKQWLKIYPSLKSLGSWIQDLKVRVQQFTDWITNENMPVKVWLPGFISPTSVLYATLQIAAKNNDITLKELIWEYQVSVLDESHITEAPSDGIYIRGLLLQGGGWDKTNAILIEPEPLHLTTCMPVIHFKPVTESSVRGVYNCPCYYTSKKVDDKGNSLYLFRVDLKTKKGKEHWIKRSTSLILSSK